jgi:catechol 2,3-dioxygenase-like lactoylglutathione lyase family enzyme
MSDDFPAKLHYHHTGIFVSDLERSIKWYEDVLSYRFAWRRGTTCLGSGPWTYAF